MGVDISVGAPNFMQMTINNYFNIGCGTCAASHTAHTNMQAADDFDWIRGVHHLSFGGSWMHEQYNVVEDCCGDVSQLAHGNAMRR